MSWIEAILLGALQGLTEFLPISSSAHLAIFPQLFGRPDPGASFTAVTQIGTELAVILFFAKDIWRIASTWTRSLWQPVASRTPRRPHGLVHHHRDAADRDRRSPARGHHPDHLSQPLGDRRQPGHLRPHPGHRRSAGGQRTADRPAQPQGRICCTAGLRCSLWFRVSRVRAQRSAWDSGSATARGRHAVRVPSRDPCCCCLGDLPTPRRQRQCRAGHGQDHGRHRRRLLRRVRSHCLAAALPAHPLLPAVRHLPRGARHPGPRAALGRRPGRHRLCR